MFYYVLVARIEIDFKGTCDLIHYVFEYINFMGINERKCFHKFIICVIINTKLFIVTKSYSKYNLRLEYYICFSTLASIIYIP